MRYLKIVLIVCIVTSFCNPGAYAQENSDANPSNASVSDQGIPSKAAAKAERKHQRKLARAKKNADLKKLEDSGYRPGQNDPNYPQNVESAEKKVQQGQSPPK
ncbi:DUF4148 domain-containing protein [Caballeronia sp. KNU42]